MTALVLATLAREVPAPADTTGAPQWVHLLPSGDIQGRDGRSYSLTDPAALVADFEAGALDLVVDFEHASENPARRLSGPVPAAGWIRQLQARADGIWGCVEWTAQAADLITAKAYRYLSPVILHHPDTHEIMRLKGAGLVHAPNLMLQSLNAQETPMTAAPTSPATPQAMAQFANMIAQLLGLPPDTPPDGLLAKIKAKLIAPPDPSKFMAVSAVQEMLADRLQERGKMVEGRAQEKVRVAVQSGYIANGMRGGRWTSAGLMKLPLMTS
jgi:phage I-like protein